MKKNISINLQGLIFHIEEDGYEVLQRYLQDVKAHFSTYRGHEEIVADIEGRIAEIFAARTSVTKQVITFEDVEAMVAKMGRVQDFQQDGALDEDDDAADTASYGQPLGGAQQAYAGAATARPATGTVPPLTEEPRRLYRDMSNRRMAGVAAGLARYFNVNPLWIRLAFVLSLFSVLIGDFFGALPAISILTYAVLWIALPKRYDDNRPMPDDDVTRKLFRDTDNGSIGGVATGLAHYLGVEVAIMRIVFVLAIFAGGTGLLLYLILWMVVPPAVTLTQKAQMRGEAVTLSGLENSLRNPSQPANRPVGAFLEEIARAIRPIVRALGTVARVFVGLTFLLLGFGLLMSLLVLLGVALGWLPESQNIELFDQPAYTVLAGVPSWFVFSGFLAAGIPVLLLLFSGVGLLVRRWLLGRTLTLLLLGLWMIGIVGSVMGGVRLSQEFQEEGYFTNTRNLGSIANPTVLLDVRSLDFNWDMRPDLTLAAADSGNVITLVEDYSAHGRTEAAGAALARTSIAYRAVLRDSSVVLDDHFTFKPGAIFRAQELNLTLRVPRNKRIRLTRSMERLLDDDNFVNGHQPRDPSKHVYELLNGQLKCLDCTEGDIPNDHDEDYSDSGEDVNIGDVRVHVDTDHDDVRVTVDGDEDVDFSTDPEAYGPGRETYQFTDFNDIQVSGAYRLVIRHGEQYRVEAFGTERALRDLLADSPGNELKLRPRRSGFFNLGTRSDSRNRVLIVVETPELESLDLSGAVQAKVEGFEDLGTLRVDQSGASHLSFRGRANSLALDMSGACRATLQGSADRLSIDGSGVSQVYAAAFPVQRADVEMSGAGEARLNVTEELYTDLTGATNVSYRGTPGKVRNEKSGASKVRRVE
jgi:phage shock protein PspC (stress-responsive transcriptional regulator)